MILRQVGCWAIILRGDNTWQFEMISIVKPGVGGAAQCNNNQHCIIKFLIWWNFKKRCLHRNLLSPSQEWFSKHSHPHINSHCVGGGIVLKRKVVFVNLYLKHILIKYLIQNINKSDSQMNWFNLHLNDYETNNLEITLVNK